MKVTAAGSGSKTSAQPILLDGLQCGNLLPGDQPVVQQQFIDPFGRVTHDPPQDIFQVFLVVDVQVPAGLNQRRDRRGGVTAVLAADCDHTNLVKGQVGGTYG